MADYSEFPTTPTAWQEQAWAEPVTTPDDAQPEPARHRDVEPLPLVAGVLFILLAVLLMAGVDLPTSWLGHGIAWIALIGAGLALLANELRKARHRS